MKASTLILTGLVLTLALTNVRADWPMYRGDAARTACAAESLGLPLVASWTRRNSAPPRPAWPRSRRMQFDRAFQPVASGDRVLYGSSVDGTVTALERSTGAVAWQVVTEGPVRFAPALWRDRAFVASDDGCLYALRLSDGSVLWKHRGGPTSQCVLGNEAMISKWPARGGPVVVDDSVYYAAGIWPSEGIYLYALDAGSGRVIWQNTDSGAIYMPQPHGGANARSGVSAQGYLVVSGDHLFVPTGRAVPASFDRHTGEFRYFHLQSYGQQGESLTMAIGDVFFNGGIGFDVGGGRQLTKIGTGQLAASPESVFRAFGTTLAEYAWREEEKPDRKGNLQTVRSLTATWSQDGLPTSTAMIIAGEQIVLGGDGRVSIVDTASHRVTWEAPVDGVAYGLAAADQQLLVSTDHGTIHSFRTASDASASPPRLWSPEHADPPPTASADVAEDIIRRTGVTRGYCLDLGCGDGTLACELAKRTELTIIAVDPDAEKVEQAREMLIAAGLYGNRVVVHQRPCGATGYPTYFADLIVSRRALDQPLDAAAQQEARRLVRPYGGASCLGTAGSLQVAVRGALEGAGSWTHQYADPANTVNSGDALIQGPLGMLWFRDVEFDVPSRHGRAPAPLLSEGRLFHEGMNGVVAVNAYNGRQLWRYQLPNLLKAYDGDELMGVSGTGSNFCVGGDSIFVRTGNRCLRLSAADGTLLSEFMTPEDSAGERGIWGFLAWDDGILYGTTANPEHVVTYRYVNRGGDMTQQLTESRDIFAIDVRSGSVLWRYTAEHSIRHNAIAIAAGRVFLIDRPLALFDRVKKSDPKTRVHPTGKLLALDARTGEELWENDHEIYGTLLAASAPHGALLMSYQPTRFRLDSEKGGRMAAFRVDNGQRMWDIEAAYDSRPTLNDRTVYTQGGAWDLLTGQRVPFDFERSYGCGILACAQDVMVYRSATLGYYDLSGARETLNYGGIRPGCWINTIPAGGIVLVPDATAGCECSYLNKAWIALEPLGAAPRSE